MLRFWEMIARAPEGTEGGAEQEVETPVAEQEVETPEVEVEQEAPTPAPTPMVPVDVMQRRLAAITKQKNDLARELELARAGQQLDPAAAPQPKAEIAREAAAMAAQIDYNRRAQAVTDAGARIDPQFLQKINTLASIVGDIPPAFVESVMEIGESYESAAELLLDLSNDTGKAAAILAMSSAKQAATLVKMKMEREKGKAPTAPRTTKTPPNPIVPRVGAGRSPEGITAPFDPMDTKKTSAEDWIAQRNKQIRESRGY